MERFIDVVDIHSITIDEDGRHFTGSIEVTPYWAQPQGFIAGGLLIALAENAAGWASIQLLPPEAFPVGQHITANHLHSKKAEGRVYFHGELLHKGRRSHVWDVRICDEDGGILSQVTATNAIVRREK